MAVLISWLVFYVKYSEFIKMKWTENFETA